MKTPSVRRSVFLSFSWIIGLLCSLSVAHFAQGNPPPPQPSVYFTAGDVPSEVLIGEQFTFKVRFRNGPPTSPPPPGTAMGFQPFIDLVVDYGGANRQKNCTPPPLATACDGIDFISARIINTNPAIALPPAVPAIKTTPCGATLNTSVPHPFASVAGFAPLTLPPGAQLITLPLHFGSFDTGQGEIVVEVTASLSNLADPGVPLKISARGGFEYGTTPANDPQNDPPIFSDPSLNSTQWSPQFAQAQITPRVMTMQKQCLAMNGNPVHEDETATGPNFPLKYQITVNIANGQHIQNLVVKDILPNNVQYHGGLGVVWPGNPPPAVSFPGNGPGGTLSIAFNPTNPNYIVGTSAPNEITITFDFYIPLNDSNGHPVLSASCTTVDSTNKLHMEGDWFQTPPDPCDQPPAPPVHLVTDVTAANILHDKCLAVQKSVKVLATGTGHPIPGDTLEYTINFQIADGKTFGNLNIEDCLTDGQLIILSGGTSPPPTLTANDQFGSIPPFSAFVPNSDLLIAPDRNCTCGIVTGGTKVTFNISQKIAAVSPSSNPRHAAGILTGGYATTPSSSTPATGTIVFYATITDTFTYPHGTPPGDVYVDKDDPINNCVTLSGEVFTNAPILIHHPPLPTPTGVIAEDKSGTQISIASDTIKKTVYKVVRPPNSEFPSFVVCGPGSSPNVSCATPPTPQNVSPGDLVTFRIEKTIPSGDAESLVVQDFLPVPNMDVTDPDANGPGGASWSPSIANCPSGAAVAGQACKKVPTNTLPAAVTFTQDATTNSLSFDYGPSFNWTANQPQKIDLLFTMKVNGQPAADGLFLMNAAQECEKNTFGASFCQTAVAPINVRQPHLKVQKGVVATQYPTDILSPPLTPSGKWKPYGAACPAFNQPITSANLPGLIGSNLTNANANDWVTFAIAIENVGSTTAYDIQLSDIMPINLAGTTSCLPSCFLPDYSSFCVRKGNGTALPSPYSVTPGGGGTININFLNNSLVSANTTGSNILIITFNAQVASDISLDCRGCSNAANLTHYSSLPGGPNFVASGITPPFSDDAALTACPILTKSIVSTSEPHTTPQSSGSSQTPVDATIGEIVRYDLLIQLPQAGVANTFDVTDILPPGMQFLPSTASIVFISNQVNPGGIQRALALGNSFDFSGAAPLPPAAMIPPAYLAPASVITVGTGPGGPVTFHLANVQNLDHDPDAEYIQIEFNALVVNGSMNQAGTVLPNTFNVSVGGVIQTTSNSIDVHVVEPNLTLTKTVAPTSIASGGNATYTVNLHNPTSVEAFDITFSDTLPAGLTLVPNSILVSGCPNAVSTYNAPLLSVSCLSIAAGGNVTITYQATTGSSTCSGATLTNQALVHWTSLPGSGTQGLPNNPTGSNTPPCSSSPTECERDYSATASVSLTVTAPPCAQPPPYMVAWWPFDETGGSVVNDLALLNNQGIPQPVGPLSAVGAPNPVPGFVGGAMDFDSNYQTTGPNIQVANDPEINFGTGDFTIDTWVKVPQPQPQYVFIHPVVDKLLLNSAGTQGTGYALYLVSSQYNGCQLQLTIGDGTLASYLSPFTSPVPFGAWAHVAVAVQRGVPGIVTFYVNGIAVSTTSTFVPPLSLDNNLPLLIGESRFPGLVQADIVLDELEMFNQALLPPPPGSPWPSAMSSIYDAGCAGKCKCVEFTNEQIICNADGTFDYSFTLTNLSNSTIHSISFNSSDPGVTFTFNPPLLTSLSPGASTHVDVTIAGANCGATLCIYGFAGWSSGGCEFQHCIALPCCPTTACAAISNPTVTCNPAVVGYSAQFTLQNQSCFTASTVNLSTSTPGVMINPATVSLSPLMPGDSTTIPFIISGTGATAGTTVCVDGTLISENGACSCKFQQCVTLPDCTPPCATFSEESIICKTDGSLTYYFKLTNPSSTPINSIYLSAPNVTPTPYPVPFLPISSNQTTPLLSVMLTGPGLVGVTNLCFNAVSNNTVTDESCQSQHCVTLPTCTPPPCATPPPNMVSWWKLDEPNGPGPTPPPGVVVDMKSGYNGTPLTPAITGVPSAVTNAAPGMVGGAFSIGLSNVSVPDNPVLKLGNSDLAIDAWVGSALPQGVAGIVDKLDMTAHTGYAFYIENATRLLKLVLGDGTAFTTYTSSIAAPTTAGFWHHAAVTLDRTSSPTVGTFYVDGVADPVQFAPLANTASIAGSSALLLGGSRLLFPPGVCVCEYELDEVEIFNGVVSAADIKAIFAAGPTGKCVSSSKPKVLKSPPSSTR